MVGVYNPTNLDFTNPTGYALTHGNFRSVNFPGSTGTYADGINKRQEIVGVYIDPSGNEHGFLLKGGHYSSIDFPGAVQTTALMLNDAGTIVGGYDDGTRSHGLILQGGNYTTTDFPGAAGS